MVSWAEHIVRHTADQSDENIAQPQHPGVFCWTRNVFDRISTAGRTVWPVLKSCRFYDATGHAGGGNAAGRVSGLAAQTIYAAAACAGVSVDFNSADDPFFGSTPILVDDC